MSSETETVHPQRKRVQSVRMSAALHAEVKRLSEAEHRSFSQQCEALMEEALKARREKGGRCAA